MCTNYESNASAAVEHAPDVHIYTHDDPVALLDGMVVAWIQSMEPKTAARGPGGGLTKLPSSLGKTKTQRPARTRTVTSSFVPIKPDRSSC